MDYKIKHLELIQAVVSRMSANSFLLKGWSIVVVSALFALSEKEPGKILTILALFPSVAFWYLDGYFLSLEKSYRGLYDHVRGVDPQEVDFNMNASEFSGGVRRYVMAPFYPSVAIFHLSVVIAIVAIYACR